MSLACLSAGRLLAQRRSGLTVAQGLKLEEHLATCDSCRADANLLHQLASLSAEAPVTLRETARQRAIAGAFASSAAPRALHTRQRARRNTLLLAAAAAAIASAWAVVRVAAPAAVANTASERAAQPRDASGSPELAKSAALEDRVLSGRLQMSDKALGTGDALREHTQLRTADGALIALAHAQVALRAGAEISWDPQARKLRLPQGSALIEVDPARHLSFEVETKAFIVTVLGTRFEVTQSSVDVLRGRVSVQPKAAPRDTPALLLAADSDHPHFELPPAAATDPAPPARARGGRAQRQSDASAWLEQARAQLAARQLAQARSTLKLAKPLLQDDASRAQALSLEAECELQAHHFSSARDTYLRVAQRFAALPAAETALFAAARIEAEHGQAQRAMVLFTSYLAKHPHGTFAREAALRREQLQRAAEPAR